MGRVIGDLQHPVYMLGKERNFQADEERKEDSRKAGRAKQQTKMLRI